MRRRTNPIEAGIGSIPQTYLMLPDAARLAVRQEVRAKLAEFEADGRLRLSLEMLIGSGVASPTASVRQSAPNSTNDCLGREPPVQGGY